MSRPSCPRCTRSVNDGPLFRVNPKLEIGIFVCMKCITAEERAKLDPDTVKLTTIIHQGEVESGFDDPSLRGEVPPPPLV